MAVFAVGVRKATTDEIGTNSNIVTEVTPENAGDFELFNAENTNANFAAIAPNNVTPGSTIGWSSGPDEIRPPNPLSYSVTRTSGPGTAPTLTSPTATSRTGTWTEPGTHIYEIQVTDGQGLQSQVKTITLNVTQPITRPEAVATNDDGWTPQGAADLVTCVGDDSDATYARSPATSGATSIRFKMPAVGSGPLVVTTRDSASTGALRKRVVELYDGTTWVAGREIEQLPDSPTTHSWELNSVELSRINDRSNLFVVVTDEAT